MPDRRVATHREVLRADVDRVVGPVVDLDDLELRAVGDHELRVRRDRARTAVVQDHDGLRVVLEPQLQVRERGGAGPGAADGDRQRLVVGAGLVHRDHVGLGERRPRLRRDAVGGDAAVAEPGVVPSDGLVTGAGAGEVRRGVPEAGDHRDVDPAVGRHRGVVQAAQAPQRREPPLLLAATRDLEGLDVVGGETQLPRRELRAARGLDARVHVEDRCSGGVDDAAPGRRRARYLRRFARPDHPTAPSICSSIRRLSSSAYSMGSSRAMGSTNPRTIIAIASSSESPRHIR